MWVCNGVSALRISQKRSARTTNDQDPPTPGSIQMGLTDRILVDPSQQFRKNILPGLEAGKSSSQQWQQHCATCSHPQNHHPVRLAT
jgi:hypothetical protein